MGFLHILLGKDRVWSDRPKAFQEPGLKIHAPKSCDTNICDINGIYILDSILYQPCESLWKFISIVGLINYESWPDWFAVNMLDSDTFFCFDFFCPADFDFKNIISLDRT